MSAADFTETDLARVAALLRDAARTEVMPRWRNLAPRDVREKSGPLDLVTEADEAAERMITAGLHHLHPGCVVVGEEATAADPSLPRQLAHADLAFVVDPIDGTSNFAAGLPLFGTMMAALRRGRIVAAAIYDPLGDDTALALRDEGAWMQTRDGGRRRLRAAAPAPVSHMVGSALWRHLPPPQRGVVCAHVDRVAAVFDYRCAAHQYRMIADGHCHFLLFNKMMPWDHAPGWLLHRESGGYSARLDGAEYDPTVTDGGLLCAPDLESWRALYAALLGD